MSADEGCAPDNRGDKPWSCSPGYQRRSETGRGGLCSSWEPFPWSIYPASGQGESEVAVTRPSKVTHSEEEVGSPSSDQVSGSSWTPEAAEAPNNPINPCGKSAGLALCLQPPEQKSISEGRADVAQGICDITTVRG